MIDATILIKCRDWIKERTGNINAVPNLAEEKKEYYRALFQISLSLLKWYGDQSRAGVHFGESGEGEKYLQKENHAQACLRLSDYYNSIANIANEDLKKSKNKQKEEDELTMMVCVVMLRLIEFFKKTAFTG